MLTEVTIELGVPCTACQKYADEPFTIGLVLALHVKGQNDLRICERRAEELRASLNAEGYTWLNEATRLPDGPGRRST